MIQQCNIGLRKVLVAFLNAYYSTASDISASSPIYIDNAFSPTDSTTFSKLLTSGDYSIVIYDYVTNNLPVHGHDALKLEYTAQLAFVRKTGFTWDTANLQQLVTQGSSSPAINSAFSIATNFAKYLRQYPLNDASGVVSFWQEVERVSEMNELMDFTGAICSVRALYNETRTISVTTV